MKVQKIVLRFLVTCSCISIFILVAFFVNSCLYARALQLKIVDDISPSESQLLQKEFGITLPSGAQITRSGYCSDEIVIRIEGVEDLSSFLKDSIHLELDKKSLQTLTDRTYNYINGDTSPYKDMYGTERQSAFFLNSNYQKDPIDSSTESSFFLLDGKLVIEIQKSDVTSANREEIKKIYKR